MSSPPRSSQPATFQLLLLLLLLPEILVGVVLGIVLLLLPPLGGLVIVDKKLLPLQVWSYSIRSFWRLVKNVLVVWSF